MRVVHVQRIGGIGGSERHVLTLLPALAERGLQVSFVGLDNPAGAPGPFYAELEAARVPSVRLECPSDVDPLLVRRLRHAVRELGPDLVHTHLVHADLYGALALLGRRIVLVSTKHNDDRFRTGPFRLVERLVTRRAARVIAITDALRRFTVTEVGVPARKVETIHYGLDRLPQPWAADLPPGVREGARVLLAIARLEAQKGLDVAVRALPAVRRSHRDAVLVVLGEGSERAALEALARREGVADAVFLPGRVGDVAAWLYRAELLLHPARWEGFGLALLEAMLASRPVVATAVSSVPEIVADGETGVLVPPEDPAALAQAVSGLLDDPARASRYGRAGYERARASFSVDRMARRTAELYERACDNPSRVRPSDSR
ncbi:MAG: glycosyltransferase family 4 protein [Gaiellaceae bacterium]